MLLVYTALFQDGAITVCWWFLRFKYNQTNEKSKLNQNNSTLMYVTIMPIVDSSFKIYSESLEAASSDIVCGLIAACQPMYDCCVIVRLLLSHT